MNCLTRKNEYASYFTLLEEQCFCWLTVVAVSILLIRIHMHVNSGALIASVGPGQGKAFTDWIDRMMDINWQSRLTLGSVTEVIYA